MTHYLHNGQLFEIDRMPPREPQSDEEMLDKQLQHDWAEFYVYLLGRNSHPHAFSGESRVVPEDEIEWRLQHFIGVWVKATQYEYDFAQEVNKRRVATPINESPGYTSGSGEEEESLLDIAKSMYESAKKLLEQLKNG